MNNKGFVLVETIITSVFVLSLFTFIIANIIPLIGEYEKRADYDSIESIYDAHMIRKMILKSDERRVTNLVSLPDEGYYLFENSDICLYLSNINYCNKLLSRSYLDVSKIVLTTYTISDDFVQRSKDFGRALNEYITQMQRYNNTGLSPTQYAFERRLIIEFNDGRIVNIELLLDGASGGATC
jgi:hypothetical protein